MVSWEGKPFLENSLKKVKKREKRSERFVIYYCVKNGRVKV